MTIIEQLDRLATIAPETCLKTGKSPDNYYKIGGYAFFSSYYGVFIANSKDHFGQGHNYTGRPALAWLRDALEQVIEARGWYWELRYWKPKNKYKAEISNRTVWADTPAEALLAALIAAVEEK